MKINELNEGIRVIENYLVSAVTRGTSNSGQLYLSVTLQDNTGTIEGKIWDASDNQSETFKQGNFVKVMGDVIEYRNNLQIKILTGELINIQDIKLDDYILVSPVDFQKLKSELDRLIGSLTNKEIKAIVSKMILDRYTSFTTYPAASKLHHEYSHGLLEHSVALANLADKVIGYYLDLYEGKWIINRDLVIGGLLIHDLGKTIELSGPVMTNYTLEGKLIGHISLVNAELMKVASELGITSEIPTLLSHIVLSHHGKQEFGSPVTPLLKEAVIVSMLDDLDAKMKIVEKALSQVAPGEFTDRIWALDQNAFYRPKL